MGWIGTIGSLGRISMPLLSSFISTKVSFLLAGVISLLSFTLLIFYSYFVKSFKKKYLIK